MQSFRESAVQDMSTVTAGVGRQSLGSEGYRGCRQEGFTRTGYGCQYQYFEEVPRELTQLCEGVSYMIGIIRETGRWKGELLEGKADMLGTSQDTVKLS